MLDFLADKKPKILIIGDLMVDNYIWCDCKRVSPEAPVLVMNAKRNDKRLGGAANVYANLQSLGAKAYGAKGAHKLFEKPHYLAKSAGVAP